MLSGLMTSKIGPKVSFYSKKSFHSTLAKMANQLQSHPEQTVKLSIKANDIIVSTNDINNHSFISYIITCLQSCNNPHTKQLAQDSAIFFKNAIPSDLDELSDKNIKKIVVTSDPKQCAVSFYNIQKTLFYSSNHKDYLREYLFSNSLGYTPYLFLVEWYKYLNNNPDHNDVLVLFHEDFINNKKQAITMIADHLDLDIEENLIDNIDIENVINNKLDILDDELNEECCDYWRNYVEYHIGSRYIDYEWFRFMCTRCDY